MKTTNLPTVTANRRIGLAVVLGLSAYATLAFASTEPRRAILHISGIACLGAVAGAVAAYQHHRRRQQYLRSQPSFRARQQLIRQLGDHHYQQQTLAGVTIEYFTHSSANGEQQLTVSRQPVGQIDMQYTIEQTTRELAGPHETGNLYKYVTQFYVFQTKRLAVEHQEQVVYKRSNGTTYAMDPIKPSRQTDSPLPDDIIAHVAQALCDHESVRL